MTIDQVMVDVFHYVVERQLHDRALGSPTTATSSSATQMMSTSATPSPTSSPSPSGPTSSPLLFFVALGFGVVFTNLWIIVGVKYCFRYNARNRALRASQDADHINMENMPRPHRRRREKKLMTMDEVNERFPLTKYKNWVATRASEGLPTTGGVTAMSSRVGSIRNEEGVLSPSPGETNHTTARPASATPESEILPAINDAAVVATEEKKEVEAEVEEKDDPTTVLTESENPLEQVHTSTNTIDKQATVTSEGEGEEDDDDDDHIHTAVPPELLTNPGDSCAICIDTLEDNDDIRGLTCGHAFHAGCIDPWLTSRRACCPLCKADYYTPKPRPDGEPTDAERAARRSTGARMNMPREPRSAWTGIRTNPRIVLTGRFTSGYPGDGYDYGRSERRNARAARRQAQELQARQAAGADNGHGLVPARWRNPFATLRLPVIRLPGRNRQANETEQTPGPQLSPSQLEAGTGR
ncbi:hypothetical protein B7494_g6927 [Chlorociboria aeruginascens]|nr:hypothetical protein B7494_g6927 [Chlorociboria aeruginascens]